VTEVIALFSNSLQDSLVRGGGQTKVDKARTGNFRACQQSGGVRIGQEGIDDLLSQLARVATGWFGQLHGNIAGSITVRSHFGALQRDVGFSLGQDGTDGSLEAGD